MNIEERKKEFDKLDRKVLMLTYGDSDLSKNVQLIANQTTEIFGKTLDIQNRVGRFLKLPEKRESETFELTKIRFLSDLSHFYLMSSAADMNELFGKIKRIELKEKATNDIFIVHGHNEKMKTTVSEFINSIGLKPIILHQQPNRGSTTIIEKIEANASVGFAIILLSGDDLGYKKNETHKKAKHRARQNVIFELGFFIGKIGRENVIGLYEEIDEFEFPSDYQGILYEPYDKKGNWKKSIISELKECGYNI